MSESVGPDATHEQRAAAIATIRDLQTQGFELLVNEKLAADASFRIFIELTNDSIEKLWVPDLIRHAHD